MNINDIISEFYFNPISGFKSVDKTLTLIRRNHPALKIKREDVQKFIKDTEPREFSKERQYNSFIPQQAGHQMQFDLAFTNRFPGKSPFKYAFFAIDSFSKKLAVIAQRTKSAQETTVSLDKAIQQLGIPVTVMSDEGSEFINVVFRNRLKYYDIKPMQTRRHAIFAERAIRTVKEMITKRMRALKINRWDSLIDVVVNQYNNEIHQATGLKPNEANKIENHDKALERMRERAKHGIKRPDVNIGDYVRVLKKPEFGKSYRVGEDAWSRYTFKILNIELSEDGTEFTLEHQNRKFLRYEMKPASSIKEPTNEQLENARKSLDEFNNPTKYERPFRRLRKLRPDEI